MKKTLNFLALIIFLFSCSKNEPTICKYEKSYFIGQWKLTQILINDIDVTQNTFKISPCDSSILLNFNADSSFFTKSSYKDSNNIPCNNLSDIKWYTYTNNNKNYLILKYIFSTRIDTLLIIENTCSNFTYYDNSTKRILTRIE